MRDRTHKQPFVAVLRRPARKTRNKLFFLLILWLSFPLLDKTALLFSSRLPFKRLRVFARVCNPVSRVKRRSECSVFAPEVGEEGVPVLRSPLFTLFPPVILSGGQCWTEMDAKTGRCNSLLSLDSTREECCAGGSGGGGVGAFAAFSSRDFKPGELFFFRAFRGGVPCEPCQSKCPRREGDEDQVREEWKEKGEEVKSRQRRNDFLALLVVSHTHPETPTQRPAAHHRFLHSLSFSSSSHVMGGGQPVARGSSVRLGRDVNLRMVAARAVSATPSARERKGNWDQSVVRHTSLSSSSPVCPLPFCPPLTTTNRTTTVLSVSHSHVSCVPLSLSERFLSLCLPCCLGRSFSRVSRARIHALVSPIHTSMHSHRDGRKDLPSRLSIDEKEVHDVGSTPVCRVSRSMQRYNFPFFPPLVVRVTHT